MKCLHCGDCCLRMSPLGSPCPKLVNRGDFFFCGDYANRPQECANHCYSFATVCPIGIDKLRISSSDEIHARIDAAYTLLNHLKTGT